ncbi:MAG TPA: SDR family NAD(P)-dependent oxidoreductase, partial [Thermoanaerobaculia bacterium]|nr:SDR family NAD(P)-dependent oxidoreductase [Thermoanaerobaculia bacterium]
MIDFIEYVLNELKSKRLSKANAIALVRQYSRRSPGPAAVPVIHPLLHRNTSDLVEQRYSSTFTGDEFFLADHQVRGDGGGRRVLPGVAYLEMARAAVEQALPRPEGTVLELHNTVWAQPVVVLGSTQVNIALSDVDDERVDYEVYSQDGEQEIVHCQGQALVRRESGPSTLDLDALRAEMQEGGMEAAALYDACARMGLLYGPALQSVESLARGTNQVLARLHLPSAAADDSDRYFLHPSVMDGALQAAVGLAGNADATEPRLPFALDTLRILAPCGSEMYAWLRLTPGSRPSDKILKLDIDLCDVQGNVAVQMRGFSWRALAANLGTASIPTERIEAGTLIAVPQWQESAVAAPRGGGNEFAERHLVVCERLAQEIEALERLASPGGFASLQASPDATLAERYNDYAIACFERVQDILRRRPQGKVLLQLVVPNDAERAVLAGLSALLRTAQQENPQFYGQTLLVSADGSWGDLARIVEAEKDGALDALVRYDGGTRRILRWQETAPGPDSPVMAFKDGGVYLITGGRGGLGSLFAKEILERTRGSHVVLTGRAPSAPDALSRFAQFEGRISYRQVDLESAADVNRLMDGIGEEHGRLDGILHSAGTIADDFILRKTSGGFRDVLAPKVAGTFHLDQATRGIDLDFFVLFSAIGGALGNLGQADYATANAFLDHFAAYRNGLVAKGERHGRTRSINWPLWKDGGMGVDPANQERLRQTTGMQPMTAAAGMAAFHRSLVLSCDQMMVVEGDPTLIRGALLGAPATMDESPAGTPATVAELDSATLAEKTEDYLRRELAETLKVPAQKIDPRAALENYGIDSILAMKLTNQLETTFGSLPKTLFF